MEIEHSQIITPNDQMIAEHVMASLQEAYPNHPWYVYVDSAGGVIQIKHTALSDQKGFVLKLQGMFSASDLKDVAIRAGGEILERYNVSRGRFNAEEIAALPTDFAGRHVADEG